MSLNFDLSKVPEANWKREDGGMNGLAETLVWACLFVGMTSITKTNWTAFYARCAFYEALNGAMRSNAEGPVLIQPEEVQRFIGLSTNVRIEQLGPWMKRVGTNVFNEHQRVAERLAGVGV